MHIRSYWLPLSLSLSTPLAASQTFQTPGMPASSSGQSDQSSNEFNPAIGAVLDLEASWLEAGADAADDGLDFSLRSLEVSTNAWVDPDTWAYALLVGDEQGIELEEAALHYRGLGGNSTLRAGRFFVDFGKQMQSHVHDLPYPERPGVLRAYLGSELAGTGLQYDDWFATGDESALRFSLGVFDSLRGTPDPLAEGPDGAAAGAARERAADRHQFDEVALTARLTGFSDAGESGIFQWGLSARHAPDFELLATNDADVEVAASSLENSVLGLDLTYGWTDETGERAWTLSCEFLRFQGDLTGELSAAQDRLDVYDDPVSGSYAWLDRKWNARISSGLLFSTFEQPEPGSPRESEYTLYWTRHLTEFSRLRLALSHIEREQGADDQRLMLQFTNYIGAHGHGLNW